MEKCVSSVNEEALQGNVKRVNLLFSTAGDYDSILASRS
jgi:hypothetical protein